MTKEEKMALLMQILDGKVYLNGKIKSALYDVGTRYWENTGYLYRMYKALGLQEECFKEELEFIGFETKEDGLYLLVDEEEQQITKDQIKDLLISIIDVCEKILSLGTLVELKTEHMKKIAPEGIETLRIIITHRFLDYTEQTYFPYAGVPYPTGMLGSQSVIHLSAALIDKVIQEGYTDELEEAYVYLMKEEFLITRDMHSVGFANQEEKKQLQERMKSNG